MQDPQPQLAELLRTCVYPASLLLEIVHIEFLDVKDQGKSTKNPPNGDSPNLSVDTHRYAVKYVLSDGEIMMQGLLHRKLIGLRDVADVVAGDLLDIRRFTVKKSSRSDGQGRIVYLAIEDCHFLHRIQSSRKEPEAAEETLELDAGRKRKRINSYSDVTATGVVARANFGTTDLANNAGGQPPVKRPSLQHASDRLTKSFVPPVDIRGAQPGTSHQTSQTKAHELPAQKNLPPASGQVCTSRREEMERRPNTKDNTTEAGSHTLLKNTFGARQIIFDDEEDDFFEALPTDQVTVKRRRKALQLLDGNASFNSQVSSVPDDSAQCDDETTPSKPPKPGMTLTNTIAPAVIHDRKLPPPLPLPDKSVRDGTLALSQTSTFYKPKPPPETTTKPQPPPRKPQTQPAQPPTQPAALPPPPFHTLSSLRNPSASQNLPAKSYTLTTLAVISWTGTTTIHRPGSLFPPKRHLKIVDPSLATSRPPSRQLQARHPTHDSQSSSFKAQNSFQDAVTVAVYIDAANFKPASGTLVLFRGLVMQRLVNGDIILNAYGKLKEQRFEEPKEKAYETVEASANQENMRGNHDTASENPNDHWFITDHSRIRKLGYGSRLDYYLDWWAEKQRAQLQQQAST